MKKVGLLFDLDGTILDTTSLIIESFRFVFRKYKPGYTLSEEELLSFLGPSLHDSFSHYFEEELIEELIAYYREFNHQHHAQYVTVYPTVIETLTRLKKEQYPMAIVTTKALVAADIGLEMFDLYQYFDTVICLDDVSKAKPDPEGLQLAMDRLEVSTGVMIGDNVSDIKAGKNANIYTVAVKWSVKGYEEMEALGPDLLVDQMDEIVPFIKEIGEKICMI